MKAHYDEKSGEIVGFYDEIINREIPTPTIDVTDDQWGQSISGEKMVFVDLQSEKPTVVVQDFPAPSFDEVKKTVLENTTERSRLARQILLKHISVERALYVVTKAVFAGAIGIESMASDEMDALLAPIPDIGRLIFAIEASASKKTPENRRQRSLELFAGSVMAGSFVEGLEQRAFDMVSAATNEAELNAALADIEIAQGLAICGVSLVQVNDTTKITTDILPAYAKLNSGDMAGAGAALQGLMTGGLGATAGAVAQALIAELGD